MTEQLTDNGRAWAEKHADDDVVANVALHGEGWPVAFVEASRAVANEHGEEDAKCLASS